MQSPRKPRVMDLSASVDDSPTGRAECDQWECDIEGDGTYVCGRTIRVPAVIFDEGDAKRIRKLAAWLEEAAAWVESKPLSAKAKR